MGNIYPKYVQRFVKKCPGHIQHGSRTFQKMSNIDFGENRVSEENKNTFRENILWKIDFGKVDFGKNDFWEKSILVKIVFHVWYIRRDSCMVHQVWSRCRRRRRPAARPVQPSSGAGPGASSCLWDPGGAAGWLGWPGGWPAAASLSMQSCTIHESHLYIYIYIYIYKLI